MGNDIRKDLADENIVVDIGKEKIRTQAYAVREITAEVNEKANNREVAKRYQDAFKRLLLWFQNNQGKAKILFPTLYFNKHLLYDDEEILENINKAEQLDDFLKDFNVTDVYEIRELIAKGHDEKINLLPITQKILISMGISSLEEWQEAIKDKNLPHYFLMNQQPTTDMFVYVQGLISQAKQNILIV